jgi:hypothetical protein
MHGSRWRREETRPVGLTQPHGPGASRRPDRLASVAPRHLTARRRDRPDAQAATRCGRSLETARRSEHADACGYGYCRSHSRWFWGMRLHLACAPGGTPRAAILAPADQTEREVALRLLPLAAPRRRSAHLRQGLRGPRVRADGGRTLRGQAAAPKPRRRTANGLHLSSIRQLVESVFWTLKDRLGLERHRGPHPRRHPRTHRCEAARARRQSLAQPPTRPLQPSLRRTRRLATTWNQPSSRWCSCSLVFGVTTLEFG